MTLTLSGSAGITNPQGSTTNPSIGIGTNTAGIYWPNAAIMGFTVNGAEAMRIDQQGNVLIGTTTNLTGSVLTVRNFGSNNRALTIGDTNTAASSTGLYFYTTSTANISVGTGGALTFNTAGGATELMRITSTGNVGIATTTVAAGTMLAIAGGNLTLYGSTSGSISIAAPAVAGTNTISLPAGTGTAAVQGVSTNIVTGTAITPASGTTTTLATGIPAWVKRITIQFYNIVMGTAASDLIVQLGTSGGFVTTGYSSSGTYVTNAAGVGFAAASNGMIIAKLTNQANQTLYGTFTLTTVGGNIWVGTGISDNTQNTLAGSLGGYLSLGGVLTQLQLSTIAGTPTFSSGTFNILYE